MTPTASQPLTDQPIVLGTAGFGAVLAQVDVAAVQGDHSLAGGLVPAVGRDPTDRIPRKKIIGHVQLRFTPNPVDYRISGKLRAALPTAGRYPISRIRRGLGQVGGARLELATSTV